MACPYSFAPSGWADCAGQLLAVSRYGSLFSLLGTRYGGDGTQTFGLPDLRGRVPVSLGQLLGGGNYAVGEAAGQEQVALGLADMAAHSHGLHVDAQPATLHTPVNNQMGRPLKLTLGGIYRSGTPDTTLLPTAMQTTGSGSPHNTMQPSLGLRYVIALTGIFPARP